MSWDRGKISWNLGFSLLGEFQISLILGFNLVFSLSFINGTWWFLSEYFGSYEWLWAQTNLMFTVLAGFGPWRKDWTSGWQDWKPSVSGIVKLYLIVCLVTVMKRRRDCILIIVNILLVNAGRQLPKARKAIATENVAAEPPNEADGRRSGARLDRHTVAHSLWRFQMLISINQLKKKVGKSRGV